MLKIIGFIISLFLQFNCTAQNYQFLKSFTEANGLPSNHIYKIIEDDNGFLWIATDNGLCRFDGKYFQVFTTKDGLPDNDVIDLIKDNEGTIWINTFKNCPAYFDEVQNKIICPIDASQIKSSAIFILNKLSNGNIVYRGEHRIYIFKDKKLTNISDNKILNIYNDGEYLYQDNNKSTEKKQNYLKEFLYYKDNKFINKFNNIYSPTFNNISIYKNKFIISSNKSIVINFPENGILKLDSINLNEQAFRINISEKNLFVIYKNGVVDILDINNYKLLQKINPQKSINTVYQDHYNNVWMGTTENGLLLFKNKIIRTVELPKKLIQNNFLSITATPQNNFLAGNYKGEIVERSKNKMIYHKLESGNNDFWVRKNLIVNKDIYTFSDFNCLKNFKSVFKNPFINSVHLQAKSAVIANDSTILAVFLSNKSCLYKITIPSNKVQLLHCKYYRANSIVKLNDSIFYIGTNNKLVKYNLKQDSTYSIFDKETILQTRIVDITVTQENLVCVTTSNNDLVILKDDKVIKTINSSNGLFSNSICLANSKNKIWVGTREGIFIIQYNFEKNEFKYNIANITENNGLPNNTINSLSNSNDTMYVATAKGLASVPLNFENTITEIPIHLINILINQQTQFIASKYQLKNGTKYIQMQFAGVNLNGNFHHLIYALNDTTKWYSSSTKDLNIQLENGSNKLYVKAVDVNGIASKGTCIILFNISIPFYQISWFWALIVFAFSAIFFWILNKIKLKNQKDIYEKQLALDNQRLKITADLHDDIGSSLSSLQVNSAVANQLINTKPEQAKKVLDKVEEQSKKLSENIGDIIWSMKPGKDEFMTLSSRIKTFVSDIVGSTNMEYKIKIDKKLDFVINDFNTRKNIVLIVKEAVNNAVKYSNATFLKVELTLIKNIVQIAITDNGKGMALHEPKGNGLKNMEKRALELKGKFEILSSDNNGVTVKATIPI